MERMKEVFSRFAFEAQPVAIKYVTFLPEGLPNLGKVMDFCEMLREAQEGRSFYVGREDFTCIGPLILGMKEEDPIFERGLVGPRLGIFKEERANRRIYQYLPRMPRNSIRYVIFWPLFASTAEPDLAIFLLTVEQAEIILRANSYTTGECWTAMGTPVATCSWIMVYPYLSGKINFAVTGIGFGMKARRLFPEGRILLSIPWDKLPQIVASLDEMEWVPESFRIGPEGHKKKVRGIVENLKKELGESMS